MFRINCLEHQAEIGAPIRYGTLVTLTHRLTQKLISKKPGEAGHELHQIVLKQGVDENFAVDAQCWFRPMPRIKLHSEGENVKLDAQVLLETAIGSSLRLQISDDDETVVAGSNKQTGVRLKLFAPYNMATSAFQSVLKGGDFVRIMHQEKEALLDAADEADIGFDTGDGTISTTALDMTQKLLCLRHLPEMKGPSDVHSASTLWQVELLQSERGGRPVRWEEPFRLKNVASDGYLDASESGSQGFGMSVEKRSTNVLTLVPALARDDWTYERQTVGYSTPFYIELAAVGARRKPLWLHAGAVASVGHGSESVTEDDPAYSTVEFDMTKHEEDAFNIQMVDLKVMQEVSRAKAYHSRLFVVLHDAELDDALVNEATAQHRELIRVFEDLQLFCTVDEMGEQLAETDPHSQNLLADLRVDELVMDFVSRPFREDGSGCGWALSSSGSDSPWGTPATWADTLRQGGANHSFNGLARKAYGVLRLMCKDNTSVGHHVARKFRGRITAQYTLMYASISETWGIPEVMHAMFADNGPLLRELGSDDIGAYTMMLKGARSIEDLTSCFHLLASLCVHGDSAVVDTQDQIRRELSPYVPKTRLGPLDDRGGSNSRPEVHIEQFVPPGSAAGAKWTKKWTPLRRFAADQKSKMYCAAIITLLDHLCTGRRYESQQLIKTTFAPFAVALRAVDDNQMPDLIRAGFAILLKDAFVDADPLEVTHAVGLRSMDDIRDTARTDRTASNIAEMLPEIHGWNDVLVDWVEKFLTQEGPHLTNSAAEAYHGAVTGSAAPWQRTSDIFATTMSLLRNQKNARDAPTAERSERSAPNTRSRWSLASSKVLGVANASRGMNEELERNTLFCEVLELTRLLVTSGFLSSITRRAALIREMLSTLIEVENAHGESDLLASETTNIPHKVIMRGKRAICHLLYDMVEHWIPERFLSDCLSAFKTEFGATDGHISGSAETWAKHPMLASVMTEGDMIWLGSLGGGEVRESSFVRLMMQLCGHGDDGLTDIALKLLTATYGAKGTVVRMLENIVILSDPDFASAEKIRRHRARFVHLMHVSARNNNFREMADIVEWFTSRCITHSSNQIVSHQSCMRHLSVHTAVLELLQEHLGWRKEAHIWRKLEDQTLRLLLSACFHFLGAFAAGNKENQVALFADSTLRFGVRCCRYNIKAEVMVCHLLSLKEAHKRLSSDMQHDLVDGLFVYTHCRNAAYLTMLQAVVAPEGVTTEEQQTKFVRMLLRCRIRYGTERPVATMMRRASVGAQLRKAVSTQSIDGQGGLPTMLLGDCLRPIEFSELAGQGLPRGSDVDTHWCCTMAQIRRAMWVGAAKYQKLITTARHAITGDTEQNGVQYSRCFSGKGLCTFLVQHGYANESGAAMAIAQELFELNLIRDVRNAESTFARQDLLLLYRFSEDEFWRRPPGTCTSSAGTKNAFCEYYTAFMSLLSVCSEGNSYTRGILEHEAPFAVLIEPVLSISENLKFLSLAEKAAYFQLIGALYFHEDDNSILDPDATAASQKQEDVEQLGLAACHLAARRLETVLSLCAALAEESNRVTHYLIERATLILKRQTGTAEAERARHEVRSHERYMVEAHSTLCISTVNHATWLNLKAIKLSNKSTRAIPIPQNLKAVTSNRDSGEALVPILTSVVQFYEERRKFDSRFDDGMKIQPITRQTGANILEYLLTVLVSDTNRSFRDLLSRTAMDRFVVRLEHLVSWWAGEDEFGTLIVDSAKANADRADLSSVVQGELYKFHRAIRVALTDLPSLTDDDRSTDLGDVRVHPTFIEHSDFNSLVAQLRAAMASGSDPVDVDAINDAKFKSFKLSASRASALNHSGNRKFSASRVSGVNQGSSALRRSASTGSALNHSGGGSTESLERMDGSTLSLQRLAGSTNSLQRLGSSTQSLQRLGSNSAINGVTSAAGRRGGRGIGRVMPFSATRSAAGRNHKSATERGASGFRPLSKHRNDRRRASTTEFGRGLPERDEPGIGANSFTTTAIFQSIFAFLQRDSQRQRRRDFNYAAKVERDRINVANVVCQLISAVIGLPNQSNQARREQRFVVKFLNTVGLPQLTVHLMAQRSTLAAAARLAIAALKCSPVENAVDHAANAALEHPHSQLYFYKHLSVDSRRAHQLFVSFRSCVESYTEHLRKRHTNMSDREADTMPGLMLAGDITCMLHFFRLLCMGCFQQMQTLLRHQEHALDSINVLHLVADIAHGRGMLVRQRLLDGFDIDVSTSSMLFPRYALRLLRQEAVAVDLLIEVYQLVGELVAGPNCENQDVLMGANICEPILPIIMYMEAGELYKGTSIDDCVAHYTTAVSAWVEEYGYGDSRSPVYFSGEVCHEVEALQSILERLGDVDEECESQVVTAVQGLAEGRPFGHPVYDSLCHHLLNDVGGPNRPMRGSTLFHNLNSHFDKALEDGINVETVQEKDSAYQSAVSYYMLISVLADGATRYGALVAEALDEWDYVQGYPFEGRVGKLEMVAAEGTIMAIFFQIPWGIQVVGNSPVVEQLKTNVLNDTMLRPDQERARAFISKMPLVREVMHEQEAYQARPHLRMLSHEFRISMMAVILSLVLNAMYISDVDHGHIAWRALGISHVACVLASACAFYLNHMTVDRSRLRDLLRRQRATLVRRQSGLASASTQQLVSCIWFWVMESRYSFSMLNVAFSVLGNVYDYSFFVFGMYGVISLFSSMQLIVRAIFTSATRLIATVLLAFVVLYTLAVIGQTNFKGQYTFPDTETACRENDAFSRCFRDHVYTFGERAVFYETLPTFGAFTFAVFYNLAVPFLLSGIVVGIITDTFGQLRNAAEQIRRKKDNECFMCSHSRPVLEAASVNGFEGHVHRDHNPWNFLSFVAHVETKYTQHQHLTGPELYALKLYLNGDLSRIWPIGRALCVERVGPHELDQVQLSGPAHQPSGLVANVPTGGARMAATRHRSVSPGGRGPEEEDRDAGVTGGASTRPGTRAGLRHGSPSRRVSEHTAHQHVLRPSSRLWASGVVAQRSVAQRIPPPPDLDKSRTSGAGAAIDPNSLSSPSGLSLFSQELQRMKEMSGSTLSLAQSTSDADNAESNT